MSSQPRLLLFTLDPDVECARRRLLPHCLDQVGRRLMRKSMASALAAGRAAGCRLEVSSPGRIELAEDVVQERQRGDSFGARLRHALQETHRRSTGPVIVVGSDVPGLTDGHIRQALDALAEAPDRVVIGPSPDGGFYLLAANRPLDAELSAVRWCTRDTLETLTSALKAAGRDVVRLAPLRDLDRTQDLARWLAHESRDLVEWRRLGQVLRQLLADLSRDWVPHRLGSPLLAAVPVRAGRGPPRR